ncbi:hypothetical protein [Aeoliella sp.]|uniref:hypothetical protein n=1 Tax=Aeoliella sp. TaxID=2795800 RepID=UPI003CCBC942
MFSGIYNQQMTWAGLVSEERLLHDREFREEALNVARAIMRNVRRNIETIVERLHARNYCFIHPDSAYVPPPNDATKWADDLANLGVYLPISYRAFQEVVGSVNLMGTDNSWPKSGYSGVGPSETWETDPLVVEGDKNYILNELEDWSNWTKEKEPSEHFPFTVSFAPDDLHKANISGGPAYAIPVSRPSVDCLVLHERHCMSFVAYLRNAFQWGGFPGFELIQNAPEGFLAEMRRDLLPV